LLNCLRRLDKGLYFVIIITKSFYNKYSFFLEWKEKLKLLFWGLPEL